MNLDDILRQNPDLQVLDQYSAVVSDEPEPRYIVDRSTDQEEDCSSFERGRGWCKIVLCGERPETWNKFWAGVHWQERRRYKSAAKYAIVELLPADVRPFKRKVRVAYRIYYSSRPQDWSNACIKPYEDALIGHLIKDDNPDFIVGGTIESHVDRENPRIEIFIADESHWWYKLMVNNPPGKADNQG